MFTKNDYAYNRKNFNGAIGKGTEKSHAYKRNMLITGMPITEKGLH